MVLCHVAMATSTALWHWRTGSSSWMACSHNSTDLKFLVFCEGLVCGLLSFWL